MIQLLSKPWKIQCLSVCSCVCVCYDSVQWQLYVRFCACWGLTIVFCSKHVLYLQIYHCLEVLMFRFITAEMYMLHALHVRIHQFGFITVYSAFCHPPWGYCNFAKAKQVQAVYESTLHIQLLFPTIPLFILIFNEVILY